MLPGLVGIVMTITILAGMLLRPAWYLEQRSGLQLLLRICRWPSTTQDLGLVVGHVSPAKLCSIHLICLGLHKNFMMFMFIHVTCLAACRAASYHF